MDKKILLNDSELEGRIRYHLAKNELTEIQGVDCDQIVASFLRLSVDQREELITWFESNRWVETKTSAVWINKSKFENTHFYVSGSDVAVAMMLLGFKVNSSREANVSKKSMDRLANKKVKK